MESFDYTLPAHWAPALINDDHTGLSEEDEEKLMVIMFNEGLDFATSCSEEPKFLKYHDGEPYGVKACDCLVFTFSI